ERKRAALVRGPSPRVGTADVILKRVLKSSTPVALGEGLGRSGLDYRHPGAAVRAAPLDREPDGTGGARARTVMVSVCCGLPPVAGVPSLRRRGRRLPGSSLRAYFFVQSGHGHWSQPQPVHAWRIMAR